VGFHKLDIFGNYAGKNTRGTVRLLQTTTAHYFNVSNLVLENWGVKNIPASQSGFGCLVK
jgi:hypothetical protein